MQVGEERKSELHKAHTYTNYMMSKYFRNYCDAWKRDISEK